jgi:carboxyl-terminal processing protease
MEDGFVKVVSPIEDTPAYRAGIRSGDLIIRLDDTPVKGMTLNDAVKRMRGKPGTQIILTVLRKGENKPLVLTLTRAVIKIQSVKSRLVEPGYGYIRITQFQEHTGDALAKALEEFARENKEPLKGLVLDLRNDPGGLLNSAVAVSAAFLPQGALVVYTDGRAEDSKMRLTADKEYYLRGPRDEDYVAKLPAWVKNVPMVVLVNGGTASASEIVSGALQDHRRAIIMGTRTFGKGSVQTVLPLGNNTAIKLTTARYFTPNGRSIQAKGIVPDITVEEATLNDGTDDGVGLREADLDHHLSNPDGGDEVTSKPQDGAPPAKPESKPAKGGKKDKAGKADKGSELASKSDYQFNQAINLLKGLQILQKK